MYGKPKELTIEEILKRVSEWDLWSYYIPGVQLGKSFNSPLRQDKTPSASLFVARNGSILLKDFAGSTVNIWTFLQLRYSLNFHEVLITINNDFNLKLTNKHLKFQPTMEFYGLPQKHQVEASAPKSIQIKRRKWSKLDKEYWGQYELSLDFIESRGVVPVQNYWINEKLIYWHSDYNPTYSYEFGNELRKLYAPFIKNKLFKFLTNAKDSVLQGFKFLPETGDVLIITKAYKDVLVLENLDYHSFAPQSESMTIPVNVIEDIKTRFKTIYLLYDNDATGIKYSTKICELHKFEPIFVPKPDKDISDYIAKYKTQAAKNLLNNLL